MRLATQPTHHGGSGLRHGDCEEAAAYAPRPGGFVEPLFRALLLCLSGHVGRHAEVPGGRSEPATRYKTHAQQTYAESPLHV